MRLPLKWTLRPRLTILQWIASVAVASIPLAITRGFLDGEQTAEQVVWVAFVTFCLAFLVLAFFWGVLVDRIDALRRLLGRPVLAISRLVVDPEGIAFVDEVREEPEPDAAEIVWIEIPSESSPDRSAVTES